MCWRYVDFLSNKSIARTQAGKLNVADALLQTTTQSSDKKNENIVQFKDRLAPSSRRENPVHRSDQSSTRR